MSWQAYVDNLVSHETIAEAAICGTTPGQQSVWASSPGLNAITEEEIKPFTTAAGRKAFNESGPKVSGIKCMMLRDMFEVEGVFCMDLKTRALADGVSYNIYAGRTKTSIIFAKGKEGVTGGVISQIVYKVVEHLRNSGC